MTIKTLFLIFWLGLIASVAAMSMAPNVIATSPGADKMLHLLVFCILTIWPVMSFTRIRKACIAIGCLFALGAMMEVAQIFVPGRTPEALDLVFNLAGITTGTVIGALVRDTYQDLLPKSYAHLQSPYTNV